MEYRIRHKKASFSVQKNVSSHFKTVLCIQTFTHHSFHHLLLGNLHPGIRSNALNATTRASVDSTRARATSGGVNYFMPCTFTVGKSSSAANNTAEIETEDLEDVTMIADPDDGVHYESG